MGGKRGIKIAVVGGVILFVVRGFMLINLLFNNNPDKGFPIEAPAEVVPAEQPAQEQSDVAIIPKTNENTSGAATQAKRSLDIAIPGWMLSPGLLEFTQKFESQNPGTKVNFITGQETHSFYSSVKNGMSSKEIDVALVPSQYAASFTKNAYTMQTKQNIKGFFHNVFDTFFTTGSINYIPFAIDPLGIISIESETKTTDFDQVLELYDQFGSMFAFGYDSPTLTLLSQNQEPYPGYFQALYQLIADWHSNNNVLQFKRFMDRQKDWSLIDRRKKLIVAQRANENCQYYSHICLLGNKEINAVAGFLGDLVVRDKELNHTTLTSDDVLFSEFPIGANKVKGRGWIINNESTDLVDSVLFVGGYIADGVGGNVRLMPNKMLSAFKKLLDIQLTQPLYKDNKSFQNNATLIYGSLEWQNLFINNTAIKEVLEANYNVELFLSQPNWSF